MIKSKKSSSKILEKKKTPSVTHICSLWRRVSLKECFIILKISIMTGIKEHNKKKLSSRVKSLMIQLHMMKTRYLTDSKLYSILKTVLKLSKSNST